MRPGHVSVVAEVVERFAQHSQVLPGLQMAIIEQGPIPLDKLVQNLFRVPLDAQSDSGRATDVAFTALRSIGGIEAYIHQNNSLFDSLEEISDREAPEQPSSRVIASSILKNSLPALP